MEGTLGFAIFAAHALSIAWLLLEERRQPSATFAWLLAFIFLPVLGQGLYFLFGRTKALHVAEEYREARQRTREVLERLDVPRRIAGAGSGQLSDRTSSLLALGERLSALPASFGNEALMLVDAQATYPEMRKAIEEARHHVHISFYIVQPDETGRALRELLVARAREGVQVRIICDDAGSLKLPGDFWEPLDRAGGRGVFFRPLHRVPFRLLKRDRMDYRNHRKILIVDGRSGFTGGINVGREYLGLDPASGHWRDTHVRLRGPAVLGLQAVFLQDWYTASGELLEEPALFPEGAAEDVSGANSIVQIVPSGPDREWSPIAFLHMHAFGRARRRIWITSPYFVPGKPMMQSLSAAALRGVDVRVLVPARPDHKVARFAAQSYYPELLRAGVRIFEYEVGFVHAKTMLVDDWVGTVGSANMDLRSFHLNWELNAFVIDAHFVDDLARQYERDLADSREIHGLPEGLRELPKELLRMGARLAAPIL